MTQTTTIAATTTTFPIELVNLDDLKQFHLAENHCFSLLTYNRIRIEAAGTSETPGNLVNISKTEARQLLAFLNTLDAKGDLRAEPIFYPPITNAVRLDGSPLSETFGTVRVLIWDYTHVHDFDYCSDGSLLITNFHTDVAIRLNSVEVGHLLKWLKG